MTKYRSKVQNQIQWQDFNLLKILLKNFGYNIKLNLNDINVGIKINK